MGLAIAHRAVQAHGGALLVSSTLGEGATFVVILPRREPRRRRAFENSGGEELLEARAKADPRVARARRPEEMPALDGAADRLDQRM